MPFGNLKGVSRRTLKFHNTRLSRVIEHSYHAMAIDERRKPYWVMLWTEFFPEGSQESAPIAPDQRFVEQRWFSGAHANVGGGYRVDPLPDRPVAWLQEKASARGLRFRCPAAVTDEDLNCLPTDSYSQFLGGVWKLVTFGRRFTRWINARRVTGTPLPLTSSIASSGLAVGIPAPPHRGT